MSAPTSFPKTVSAGLTTTVAPLKLVRSGPKLLRLDKAEVIVHRVHGTRHSKLHASLTDCFWCNSLIGDTSADGYDR